MKSVFSLLVSTFLLSGGIIGAGFITGRELINFFGINDFLIPLIFSGVLFFVFFSTCFIAIKLGQGAFFNYVNINKKTYNFLITISSIISLAGLFASVLFLTGNFLFCIIVLLSMKLLLKKGFGGVEKLNMVLVPIIVLTLIIMLLFGVDFSGIGINYADKFSINPLIYVSLNVFLSLPIMLETAKKNNVKTLIIVSALVSLILVILSTLILTKIKMYDKLYLESNAPLLAIYMSKGWFKILVLIGIITSISTAYYPIYNNDYKRKHSIYVVDAVILILSALGLKNIVRYFYPVVGAFGIVVFIKCLTAVLKGSIKKLKKPIIPIKGRRNYEKEEK